jgi:Protein of unknwon function (DUF3008)
MKHCRASASPAGFGTGQPEPPPCHSPQSQQNLSGCRARIISMPAKSKKQQMAAGAALAAKRGQRSKSSLKACIARDVHVDEPI